MTKSGKWSRKYDCCRGCGTTERRHAAKGLCTSCERSPEHLDKTLRQLATETIGGRQEAPIDAPGFIGEDDLRRRFLRPETISALDELESKKRETKQTKISAQFPESNTKRT